MTFLPEPRTLRRTRRRLPARPVPAPEDKGVFGFRRGAAMRSPCSPNDPVPRGGRAPGRPRPDDRGAESSAGGLLPAGAEEADDIGAGDGDSS